jgi:hypothetical protein
LIGRHKRRQHQRHENFGSTFYLWRLIRSRCTASAHSTCWAIQSRSPSLTADDIAPFDCAGHAGEQDQFGESAVRPPLVGFAAMPRPEPRGQRPVLSLDIVDDGRAGLRQERRDDQPSALAEENRACRAGPAARDNLAPASRERSSPERRVVERRGDDQHPLHIPAHRTEGVIVAISLRSASRTTMIAVTGFLAQLTEGLDVRLAVWIEQFLAALLPCRFEFGRCDVPVRPAFLEDRT